MIDYRYIIAESDVRHLGELGTEYRFEALAPDFNGVKGLVMNVTVHFRRVGDVWNCSVKFGQDEMAQICAPEQSAHVAACLVNLQAHLIGINVMPVRRAS